MVKTKEASRSEIKADVAQRLRDSVADAHWTTQQKVALTCRIVSDAGHQSGLAGQITARGKDAGTYYTQAFDLGFDEISESNLLLVNEDLEVLSGHGMANPGIRFHSWIYRERPDVNCIIHTHPLHVAALSMLEVPLDVSQMDICPLFDDCALLERWPGVPVGNEEGEIIADALGTKRALLMAHHGQLVTGASVEEACILAVVIERAAKLQLMAAAVGAVKPLEDALAREAHDISMGMAWTQMNFAYYARRVLRRDADVLGAGGASDLQ